MIVGFIRRMPSLSVQVGFIIGVGNVVRFRGEKKKELPSVNLTTPVEVLICTNYVQDQNESYGE